MCTLPLNVLMINLKILIIFKHSMNVKPVGVLEVVMGFVNIVDSHIIEIIQL
jgi:hypothetical protein